MTFGWHSDDRERCQSLGLGPGPTPVVNIFRPEKIRSPNPPERLQRTIFLGRNFFCVGSATGPGPGPVADPAGGTGPDLWPPTLREAQARTCGPRPFESEPRPGPGPDPGCENFCVPRKFVLRTHPKECTEQFCSGVQKKFWSGPPPGRARDRARRSGARGQAGSPPSLL